MADGGEDQGLVERHGELALIDSGLAAAAAGRGGLVWIEGRAGIGKTELVRQACQAAARAGFGVCRARGGELEREFPFGVVRQLFEGPVRRAEPAEQSAWLSGAARQAAGALGLSSDEAVSDLLPVLHGLYWLTVNLATTRPLLVAVDDAHWADVVSLRYVDYLARRVDELPVLVVVASRPPEPQAEPDLLVRIATEADSQVIRPPPLSEDGVGRLVEGHLEGPADREFVRACRDATGGIPFLVRQLLAALREDKVVSSAAFAPAVFTTAPDTVARATRRRLASLPAEATGLAEAVAVLGDDAQLVMAAALAETDASGAATASDQLAAIGVLQPSRPLAFAHPLLRSVVYSGIPTARRSAQHRRAAGLLADAGASADRVAAQLLATEPAGDRWVVETLRVGAASALATGDPATAGTFLRRALAEPAPSELRPTLLYELGAAEQHSRSTGAIDHLRDAYELAGDARQRAEILRVLLLALMGAGRAGEVEPLLAPAIDAAAAVDPDLALRLEAEVLSVARLSVRNQIWSQARLDRWRGKTEAQTPGERLLLTLVCNEIAVGGGTAGEAARVAEKALGDGVLLGEQTADAQPFYLATYVLAAAGHFERAAELLGTARDDAVARGSALGFAMASVFGSYVALAAGRVTDAEAEAADALRAAGDEHVWPGGFPACVAAMIDVLGVQGRPTDADLLLERHDLAGRLPDSIPHRALLHSRGQLRLIAGDAQGALADFDEFDRREAGWATINPWLNNHGHGATLARARLGRSDEARERAAAALDAAKRWAADHAVGRALVALGAVSPVDEADVCLSEAVTILAASPARLDHAVGLIELGAARRRSGARRVAETTLREGLDLAARLGAGLLVERARGELAAMGRRPRRTAITGVDALTGSERRVADLAATGMTNRDIAQSLFVTTRTVEIHLSAVYRKLGIDSRSRLADALSPPR